MSLRQTARTKDTAKDTAKEVEKLWGDEIQQATARLKWRGDTLSPDTLYAVAVTGLSWESGWGREHLFSLAWGELRRVPGYKPRNKTYPALVREIQGAFERREYRKAVSLATERFSQDEIACDPNLKEAVAQSFLELRQPERAFPIFAAPFEPLRTRKNGEPDMEELDRRCREGAYLAAQQAGLRKEEIVFGLSLLFDPKLDPLSATMPASTPHPSSLDLPLLRKLEAQGVDFDRLASGILQAPENLRGFMDFAYPAVDLFVIHATPRQLPLLLHLVGTDDAYLRSRALIGLGIVAYRQSKSENPGWAPRTLPLTTLREYGISSVQRKQIAQEVDKAARSDHYLLRASACLALGLMAEEADIPLLQKLAQDRAYILTPEMARTPNQPRRIRFPVRQAATIALSRFDNAASKTNANTNSKTNSKSILEGELVGKELELARRGGQDVTRDRRNLRRKRNILNTNAKEETAQGLINFGF